MGYTTFFTGMRSRSTHLGDVAPHGSAGPGASGGLLRQPEKDGLRIGAAVEYIKAHGNLDGFPAGRSQRLALVSIAGRQGLVVWNRSRERYEPTSRGNLHVRAVRRSARNALQDRQGGAIHSGLSALTIALGAVVVVGAVFLTFNPTGLTNLAPPRQAGGNFSTDASIPGRVQVVQGTKPRADAESSGVTAARKTDPKQGLTEQVSPPLASRPDASGADANVRLGEPARSLGEAAQSLIAAMPSEPEIVTTATTKKITGEDRKRLNTAKSAHKHRQGGRRHEAVAPGYAYAPYGDARTFRYWSTPPGWFR